MTNVPIKQFFLIFIHLQKSRGEIPVKGKGVMKTYFVYDKGTSISQITSPEFLPAGIPSAISPTPSALQRQTSSHGSLAAVVMGIMQATKHNSMNATRKYHFIIHCTIQKHEITSSIYNKMRVNMRHNVIVT